jgi:uncharacterized protein YraI
MALLRVWYVGKPPARGRRPDSHKSRSKKMKLLRATGMVALAGSMLCTTAALANMSVTAMTDLNIRNGPGPRFGVVDVIPEGETAAVMGCTDQQQWCQVEYRGINGWSYSSYLAPATPGADANVTILQHDNVPVVEYNESGAAAGAAGGAVIGALVGGPIGAAVGGAIGAGVGSTAPPAHVETYVSENRPEPVYLEGEVVVGAGVPNEVTLRTVPDYDHRYAVINGQTVLVDPANRRIIHVYR